MKCTGPKPITIIEVTSEEYRKDPSVTGLVGTYCWVRVISGKGTDKECMMTIMGLADLSECRSGCLECDFKQPEFIYKTIEG